MRRSIACLVLLLTSVLLPSGVSAAGIESAVFEVGDEELALQIAATGELGDPLVRTESGYIRVWFPHVDEDVRLDPTPDGAAIRSIRIRPGFGDTSVVLFRVRPGVTVPVSAVRVERSGDRGTIFIQRDAIPLPGSASAEATAPETTVPEATRDEVAHQEALISEPPPASPNPTASAVAEEAPSDGEAATTESSREATPPAVLAADASPGMGVLLIVSLLLGVAYCVVKLVFRRRAIGPLEDIQIVSSKRLGARHQIVLVRALGEDHLLSINGMQTHCISSTPTVADDDYDPSAATEDPPSGVIARIQERFYYKPRVDDGERVAKREKGRAATAKPEKNRFGSELLRYALANENSLPEIPARPRRRPKESEAVAGLVRLRERLAQSA